jgi:hypothetical protein
MKKLSKKKEFIEEIKKTPIVAAVCNKIGISRQTVYRWLKEDIKFKIPYDESLNQGINNINDLAESKLIGAIDRGEAWAIKYWLEINNKKYYKPRPVVPYESVDEKVTGVEITYNYTVHNKHEMPYDTKDSPDPEIFHI